MEIECKIIKDFWQCDKNEEPEEVLTCVMKSTEIKQRGAEIKTIKGVYSYQQLGDVRGLEITNTIAEFFPRGLTPLLPSLNFIELSNCGLREVSKRDLCGLENLKNLRLSNNKLTSLPDDLFAKMYQLKIIDFSNNKLQHLSSNLLLPIEKSLTFANFKNNTKVDAMFEEGSENTLAELKSIIDQNCTKTAEALEVEHQTLEMVQSRVRKFEQLFETGLYSDLSIKSSDKVFKVHKNILAAQSPVLKKSIREKFDRKEKGSITIKKFSTEAVKDFLQYLYTGNISSGENIVELIGMAVTFQVEELEVHCQNIIIENIDETNAFDMFSLGVFISNEKIKRTAFDELRKDHLKISEEMYKHPKTVNEIVIGEKPTVIAESVKKVMKVKLPPKSSYKKETASGSDPIAEFAAEALFEVGFTILEAFLDSD